MIVNDGVCRKATIQLMLIEVLDVLGMLFKVLQGVVELFEIRNDALGDTAGVSSIGGDFHTRLHHFQPVHEKVGEKYRGVIKAGVNFFDGADLQPIIGNGILQGIGQLLVPIKKLLYTGLLLLTLISCNAGAIFLFVLFPVQDFRQSLCAFFPLLAWKESAFRIGRFLYIFWT